MGLKDEQIAQLEQVLEDNFFPYVPKRTDDSVKGWTPTQHRTNRLTRSLAAFVIHELTEIGEANAAASIIDGHDDNGIDAFYFDTVQKQLILVQSKFSRGSSPDLSETLKFTKGVKDLHSQVFEHFNEAFKIRATEILDAFDEPDLTIKVILVHIGDSLARHSELELKSLLEVLNEHKGRAEIIDLNGQRIFEKLTSHYEEHPIEDAIELYHWTISQDEPRVMYGQISVKQLAALYQSHGRKLFSKNIRNYTGSTDVNEAIAKTLKDEPDLLVHLNNGITHMRVPLVNRQ